VDDASLREVIRYLQQHFPGASIELLSHAATASEHGFKLRGAAGGDLFIRDSLFQDYPADRVFQRLQVLQVAEALRSAAGKRRVIVTRDAVRVETYVPRPKRRKAE
jgi:hypothetical protein